MGVTHVYSRPAGTAIGKWPRAILVAGTRIWVHGVISLSDRRQSFTTDADQRYASLLTLCDRSAGKMTKKAATASRVLYWFRTDLRITDSPALQAALGLPSIEAFFPCWCWDPNYIYGHRVGLNRWSFLLESMQDLSDQLTSLNKKQKLHVVRGPPEQVLPVMWKSWGITHIVWEQDPNAYARVRDAKIRELAKEAGVEVVEQPGRHLYDPEAVVQANKDKPTMTLHQWQNVSRTKGEHSMLTSQRPSARWEGCLSRRQRPSRSRIRARRSCSSARRMKSSNGTRWT